MKAIKVDNGYALRRKAWIEHECHDCSRCILCTYSESTDTTYIRLLSVLVAITIENCKKPHEFEAILMR